jgi:hypothetical protein
MNAHSEDLGPKIVETLRQRVRTNSEAARAFGVSRSSVKRNAKLAQGDRPHAPNKRPGSRPKMDETASRLLEADLEERAPRLPSPSVVASTSGRWPGSRLASPP